MVRCNETLPSRISRSHTNNKKLHNVTLITKKLQYVTLLYKILKSVFFLTNDAEIVQCLININDYCDRITDVKIFHNVSFKF